MNTEKNIIKQMQEYRIARGWSNQRLAQFISMDSTRVYRIINGMAEMKVSELDRLVHLEIVKPPYASEVTFYTGAASFVTRELELLRDLLQARAVVEPSRGKEIDGIWRRIKTHRRVES